MKNLISLLVLCSLAVFVVGCMPKDSDSQSGDTTGQEEVMDQDNDSDSADTTSTDMASEDMLAFKSKDFDFGFNHPKSWELTEETGLEKQAEFSVNWKKLSKVVLGQSTNLFIGELADTEITLKDYSKKVFEYYLQQADPAADLGFEENLADERSYLTVFVQNLTTGEYYMEVYTSPSADSKTVVMVSATGTTKEEAMSAAYSVYEYIYGDDLAVFIQ